MRRLVTIGWVLAAALVTLPQDSAAQASTAAHEGFFIGLGLGGGSFGCAGCGDRQSGMSGYLKLGGAVSPQLLLGVESGAWTKEESGARLTQANVSALAQYYPASTNGFFVKGGIGLSTLEASASAPGVSISASQTGLGLTAGLGYDIRVGNSASVTPYGSFGWGDFDGGSANNFQLGVGFTWH